MNFRSNQVRRWLTLAKLAVIALVTYGILRALQRASAEISNSDISLRDLDWRWLSLAALCYAVGQLPTAWFWQHVLGALGIVTKYSKALRAFYVGHLGKYLPGKLMVVVLRSVLLRLPAAQWPSAVTSVFVETLTFVAVGAFLGATGMFVFYRDQVLLQLAAVAAMGTMILFTCPPLVNWTVARLNRFSNGGVSAASVNVEASTLLGGWAAGLVTWSLCALSLFATMRAVPMPESPAADLATVAKLGTSLCAAFVAGFVSMVPGGLLAREYVLDRLLVPQYGELPALVAAVLLRAVWILTELAGSIILYVTSFRRAETP